MTNATREITKVMYDKAMANGGSIPKEDYLAVFGDSICFGYGVYGATSVAIDDGKYIVRFTMGTSCD